MTWNGRPSPLRKIDSGEITLTQGQTTDVSVGAAPDDHLLVAAGFADPTPDEDQTVQWHLRWEQADGEQQVRFEVDSASANPTLNYTVYVVEE